MPHQRTFAGLCIAASAILLAAPSAAVASFVCPYTVAANAPKNAPTLTADFFAGANDETANTRLGILVDDLRKASMQPGMIMDHLIGAYCPLVAADNSLSDAQKTLMVRRFARRVADLVYVPLEQQREELSVLVDVPVAPSVFSQINKAAERAGITRDRWIEQAITRQLAAP